MRDLIGDRPNPSVGDRPTVSEPSRNGRFFGDSDGFGRFFGRSDADTKP